MLGYDAVKKLSGFQIGSRSVGNPFLFLIVYKNERSKKIPQRNFSLFSNERKTSSVFFAPISLCWIIC